MALATRAKRHAPLPLLAILVRPGHAVVDVIALSARSAVHSARAVDLRIDGRFLVVSELDREHHTRRVDQAACEALTGGGGGQRPRLLVGKIGCCCRCLCLGDRNWGGRKKSQDPDDRALHRLAPTEVPRERPSLQSGFELAVRNDRADTPPPTCR